ncbi:MAG: cyclic nucleotide-binding domain-containing protein [Sporichthyaceae bacterium]
MNSKRDLRLDLLADIGLFAGLDRRQLVRIASMSTETTLPAASVLCREGAIGQEAFVLVEGTVTVSVAGTPIAVLGPGAVIGEMALVGGKYRNATVIADTAVRVLVMTPAEFATIIDCVPQVADAVNSLLAVRQRDHGHTARSTARV